MIPRKRKLVYSVSKRRWSDHSCSRWRSVRQAAERATATLTARKSGGEAYLRALADLDFWLRSDGHRRNPGTTADLMAAGLFVGLRQGWIVPPLR